MDRTLSDMVREARLEKGYSQEHLGELIGYSQRMISEIENKPDRYPRDRTMRLLADALAADPSQARAILLHTGARVRLQTRGVVRIIWPPEIAALLPAAV